MTQCNMTLADLDGTWKTTSDRVTAIRDVENRKGVKYGEKILERYSEDHEFTGVSGYTPRSIDDKLRDMSRTCVKGEYLKRAEKIRKMTESDTFVMYSGEDVPVLFVFYADVEDGMDYRGAFLVAPRID